MTKRISLKKLREYIRKEASSADRSSKEWQKGFPDCSQAAYRSGMWFAYYDIEKLLGKL